MEFERVKGERYVNIVNEITFRDAYWDDKYLWFISEQHSGLYQIDVDEWTIKTIYFNSQCSIMKKTGYLSLTVFRDNIICIPANAKKVISLNMRNKKLKYFDIPIKIDIEYKFRNGFVWQDKLILIPDKFPGICVIDFYSNKTIVYDDWYKRLIDFGISLDNWIWGRGYYFYNGYIYLCTTQKNMLIKLAVDTMEEQVFYVGKEQYRYYCMAGYENILYLVDLTGDVVVWNILNEKSEKIIDVSHFLDEKKNEVIFSEIICVDNKELWLFPRRGKKIVVIELNLIKIQILDMPYDSLISDPRSRCGKYYMAKKVKDYIIANTEQGDKFVLINLCTREVVIKDLKDLLLKTNELLEDQFIKRGDPITEGMLKYGLKEFWEQSYGKKLGEKFNKSVGNNI